MKKIMMGVSLGLAGMSQAHAWNGGIEDMRTMRDNTTGHVVRVKSSTTDCCMLRPMHGHGHAHHHKMVHNGRTYYCTRVGNHGKQATRHSGHVKKQHYQRQTQHAVNAQRAKRQAMYAAKAKRKALLLAQQRKRAAMIEAQKRKAVLIAQQKQRAAHQALMQAQQRKRAAQHLQQQRKLQLLAQQRRQAAQQRQKVAVAKPRPHYRQPAPRQHKVVVAPRHYQPAPRQHTVVVQPRYESSYQRYHYQHSVPRVRSSQSVYRHDNRRSHLNTPRMQPIQHIVKQRPRRHVTHRFSGHQSVARHDARMYQQRRAAQIRAAQYHQRRYYSPSQQLVSRHHGHHATGWQRSAKVQSHGIRHHKRQVVAMANTRQAHHYKAQADCGC